MTISDAAKTHHDQLFGDRVSSLAQTDPEFIEYFDNFAFDETIADAAALDDSVDVHTRLLVQLAAVLAAGGLAEFRVLAAAGLGNAGVSPVELKELVYHAVPYVGLARVFDYLHAANDVLTAAGVQLPLSGRATSTPQTRHVRQAGAGTHRRRRPCRPDARRRPAGLQTLPALPDRQLFRRHRRPRGLDLPTRELLTFAMLAALGGADAQLRGHVTGNINVGNTRARLLAVLTVLVPFIGYPRTLNALTAINDITN